jgi:hypothetical protein
MADEAVMRGPNGEELRVRSGEKSVAVIVKDLLPILVAIGAFAMMYVLTQNLTRGQERGFTGFNDGFKDVLAKMAEYQMQVLQSVVTNRQELTAQMERQNSLVSDQTQALREAVTLNTKTISERLDSLSHRLDIFSYNADRPPSERLPLDTPTEHVPKREQR